MTVVRRLLLALLAVLLLAAPAAEAHTLTYGKARAAAQKKADAFAGMATSIESLQRTSRHRYTARVEWERVNPAGCRGCGYDSVTDRFFDTPSTDYCSATLVVRYRSHRSKRAAAFVDEHSCI